MYQHTYRIVDENDCVGPEQTITTHTAVARQSDAEYLVAELIGASVLDVLVTTFNEEVEEPAPFAIGEEVEYTVRHGAGQPQRWVRGTIGAPVQANGELLIFKGGSDGIGCLVWKSPDRVRRVSA